MSRAAPLPLATPSEARLPSLAVWLVLHASLWTACAALSRGNLDVPGDMVENYVWGIEWQLGYAKHPPLFAWVAAAWFRLMPRTDLAYFALSAVNAAIGLAGVAALARRFVSRDQATLAALALAVSPLYTTLATKFNANAMLLSAWPWAAWAFAALMQGGRLRHAVACGVFTAFAVLAKYFSAVLVLAFVVAALARPAWRARWREAGPWIAIATGALAIAPHAVWQWQHHFETLGYAAQRSDGRWGTAAARYAVYVAAQVAYLLPVAGVLVLFSNARRAAGAALLQAVTRPSLRPDLWWLAFAPLVAAAVFALGARVPMASVWGMAQWFALPVLWMVALRDAQVTWAPRRVVATMGGYAALALALSAATGAYQARHARPLAAAPRAELAAAARAAWAAGTSQPLRWVGGSHAEAASVVFYGDDAVRWFSREAPAATPWADAATLARDGRLLVCRDDDAPCRTEGARLAEPLAVDLQRRAWGRAMPAERYWLYRVSGTTTPG